MGLPQIYWVLFALSLFVELWAWWPSTSVSPALGWRMIIGLLLPYSLLLLLGIRVFGRPAGL